MSSSAVIQLCSSVTTQLLATKPVKFWKLSDTVSGLELSDCFCIIKQDSVVTQIQMPQLVQILAACEFLNRVYLVDTAYSVRIIDLSSGVVYSVKTEEEVTTTVKYLHASSVFVDNKLWIIGGLTCQNTVSNNVSFFDLSCYRFGTEKISNNCLEPRFKHSSLVHGSLVFVVGGYTSSDESQFCNKLQVIKYDNLLTNWFELEISGHKPDNMIQPGLTVIANKYLVAAALQNNSMQIWLFHMVTNTGTAIAVTCPHLINPLSVLSNSVLKQDKHTVVLQQAEQQPDNSSLLIQSYKIQLDSLALTTLV